MIEMFWLLDPLLCWSLVVVYVLWILCLWLNLVHRLLMAHGRKLHASRAFPDVIHFLL